MHHRSFVVFLAASALTLAAACGGKNDSKPAATAEKSAAPAPPPARSAETPPPADPAPAPSGDGDEKGEHHKGKGEHEKGEHHKGEKGEKGEHGAKHGEEEARAGYRWEVHKKLDLRFEVPKDWKGEEKGEVWTFHSTHPGAGVRLIPESSTKIHEDEKELILHVEKHLHDAKKVGPTRKVEQHGLQGLVAEGHGKHEGKVVDWLAAALGDGHGHQLLAIAHWEPNAPPKVKEELKTMLDSIGAAKK